MELPSLPHASHQAPDMRSWVFSSSADLTRLEAALKLELGAEDGHDSRSFGYPLVSGAYSAWVVATVISCSSVYALADVTLCKPPFTHNAMKRAWTLESYSLLDVTYRALGSLATCVFMPSFGWLLATVGDLPMRRTMVTMTFSYGLGMTTLGLNGVFFFTTCWFFSALYFAKHRALVSLIYVWITVELSSAFWFSFLLRDLRLVCPEWLMTVFTAGFSTVYELGGWKAFVTVWRSCQDGVTPFVASILAAMVITGGESIRFCNMVATAHEFDGNAAVWEGFKVAAIGVAMETATRQQVFGMIVDLLCGYEKMRPEADLLLRSRWGVWLFPLLSCSVTLFIHALFGTGDGFARRSSIWILVLMSLLAQAFTDFFVVFLQRIMRYRRVHIHETLLGALIRLHMPGQHLRPTLNNSFLQGRQQQDEVTTIADLPNGTMGFSAQQLAGFLVAFCACWIVSGGVDGTFAI